MTPTSFVIAGNTFREALRERLLYNLLLFALILTGGSLTISQLTLGEQHRIIADVAASSTQLFTLVISVFLGVALVAREVDRRTCYAILARPVSRGGFVLGKALGLLTTVAINVVVMAAVTAVVLASRGRGAQLPALAYLSVFALMLVQAAVCIAFAALFASLTTPTLAVILTLAVVGSGFLFSEVRNFWLQAKQVQMKWVVGVLDYLIPNMGLLDAKESLTYGDPMTWGSLLGRGAYGLAYAAVILGLAMAVFSRRDIR